MNEQSSDTELPTNDAEISTEDIKIKSTVSNYPSKGFMSYFTQKLFCYYIEL